MKEGTHKREEESVRISIEEMLIEGRKEDESSQLTTIKSVSDIPSPLFIIAAGCSFTLTQIQFKWIQSNSNTQETSSLNTHLIRAEGKLTLSGVEFDSIVLKETALLSVIHTQPYLVMEGVTFNRIVRERGSGSVFEESD